VLDGKLKVLRKKGITFRRRPPHLPNVKTRLPLTTYFLSSNIFGVNNVFLPYSNYYVLSVAPNPVYQSCEARYFCMVKRSSGSRKLKIRPRGINILLTRSQGSSRARIFILFNHSFFNAPPALPAVQEHDTLSVLAMKQGVLKPVLPPRDSDMVRQAIVEEFTPDRLLNIVISMLQVVLRHVLCIPPPFRYL
jgi:hypothetical protein